MATPANRKNLLKLKPLCLAGSLATSISITATPSLAAVTNLGHTHLADPITAEAGDNCYLITAITNTPASQASWGKTEQNTNGNANTNTAIAETGGSPPQPGHEVRALEIDPL